MPASIMQARERGFKREDESRFIRHLFNGLCLLLMLYGGLRADTPPEDYTYKADLGLCPERQHLFLSVKKQWLCGLQRLY